MTKIGAFLFLTAMCSSVAANPLTPSCVAASELFSRRHSNADVERFNLALANACETLSDEELTPFFCERVSERLRDGAVVLPIDTSIEHVIRFELFKLRTYLSSGVFPKRYFGFFDETGDTSAYEKVLRETIVAAVPIINDYARSHASDVRLDDIDVAVTFLAEGGALLLTDPQAEIDRVHPVRGIGLDNFRAGFAAHAELVRSLDSRFGTQLATLTPRILGGRILRRPMTFREAILGTAIMLLWEKQLAASELKRASGRLLGTLPRDEQFVITSLYYNSGVLFSPERVAMIVQSSTASYLAETNENVRGKRQLLSVYSPSEARRRLLLGENYPVQLTSWSAVYHVLQRYGAWVALSRFSDTFDESGRFRRRDND